VFLSNKTGRTFGVILPSALTANMLNVEERTKFGGNLNTAVGISLVFDAFRFD
jgi:hypothetical protein